MEKLVQYYAQPDFAGGFVHTARIGNARFSMTFTGKPWQLDIVARLARKYWHRFDSAAERDLWLRQTHETFHLWAPRSEKE